MGRDFPISVSTKQKLNTKSLTESELVGIDDMMLNTVDLLFSAITGIWCH
jgi:hypothetical protein